MMEKAQVADFVIFESGLLRDRVAICVGDMITTYFSPVEARKLADILYALAADVDRAIVAERVNRKREMNDDDNRR